MKLHLSKHWIRKNKKKRKDITEDLIEFAIVNSRKIKDKGGKAFNAITRIPPSGRMLKVVYRELNEKVFIITAYWL